MNSDNRIRKNDEFGNPTQKNHVKFTVDGQETFKLIYENILKASKYIYIINYDLDPHLSFVRHFSNFKNKRKSITDHYNGLNLTHMVQEQEQEQDYSIDFTIDAENVKNMAKGKFPQNRNPSSYADDTSVITASNRTTSTAAIRTNNDNQQKMDEITVKKNISHSIRKNITITCTLLELLLAKAIEGVEIKIIVWQPKLPVRIMPNAKKKGIDGRGDEIDNINDMAKLYNVEKNLIALIDKSTPTLISGHHEKIIIIDNMIGFCGGLDMSKGKWDTSLHEFDNPIRDPNADPFHDVHCMVKGPVIKDFLYHFNQRWEHAESEKKDETQEKKIIQEHYINATIPIKNTKDRIARYPDNITKENDYLLNTEVTALRTWKDMDNDGGILKWYSKMFESVKNNIYIENQFPFQDQSITDLLIKRLEEQKNLKVIVVGPMDPNLPGLIGSMISRVSVNDINKNLKRLVKAGENGKRVQISSLISQDSTKPDLRRQIYVHSKLMIVDDEWITIGSANMDKNGFKDSSEFNLGIRSSKIAKTLRIKLWQEHLGKIKYKKRRLISPTWRNESFNGNKTTTVTTTMTNRVNDENRTYREHKNDIHDYDYDQIKDFESGFRLWSKVANDNGIKVMNNNFITGHVYPYNFKDMNLPAPYPDAKGVDTFEIL